MNSRAEHAREQLRAVHGVRLVRGDEEGTSALVIPPGVYGFTASPGLAAPLFATRRYRNFEIHHLTDGAVAIVGFVAPSDASRLAGGSGIIDVAIHPDLEGETTEIVAIRYAQIVQHRQYSVRNSAALSLRVHCLAPGAGGQGAVRCEPAGAS
jgi:hypothetical protein